MRLPRGYDDLGRVTPIAALAGVADGTVVLVRGTVRRVHVFPRRLLDVIVEEEAGAACGARWFRAHASMAKAFVKGSDVALAGPVRTATDGDARDGPPEQRHGALALAARRRGRRRARASGCARATPLVEGVKGRTLDGHPRVGAGGARAGDDRGAAAGGGARAAGPAAAG